MGPTRSQDSAPMALAPVTQKARSAGPGRKLQRCQLDTGRIYIHEFQCTKVLSTEREKDAKHKLKNKPRKTYRLNTSWNKILWHPKT